VIFQDAKARKIQKKIEEKLAKKAARQAAKQDGSVSSQSDEDLTLDNQTQESPADENHIKNE
jgi:hypothetical protein